LSARPILVDATNLGRITAPTETGIALERVADDLDAFLRQ